MRCRASVFVVSFTAVLAATGCAKSSPTSPTVSIGAPAPVSPANGTQIANLAQPVTVVVQNATVTPAGSVTYTFEVATDAGFANKVQVRSGVAEGSNGQTSLNLDALLASKDYYWHAQASGNGATSAFGATFTFTIGAVISISAPVPVSPATGSITTDRPQLVVTNAARTGPAAAISYRFEIADTPSFSPALVTTTVAETTNQTTLTLSASLPTGRTLYWRATALDQANGVSSSASTVQSFTPVAPTAASLIAAEQGRVLWPGVQPPGTAGRARMGPGWQIRNIADFLGNPFLSPTLDELRVFDLLDRGFDPDGAIGWLVTNGYSTQAVYYPSVAAIGFPQQYMALIAGAWELVLRVGA